jgi:hypothetical protein
LLFEAADFGSLFLWTGNSVRSLVRTDCRDIKIGSLVIGTGLDSIDKFLIFGAF